MGSGLRREKFSPVLRNPECLVGQIVCKIEPDSPPTRYACPFLCGFAALPNKGHSSFPLEFCTSCKPRPQETCKRKRSSMALLPESERGGQMCKEHLFLTLPLNMLNPKDGSREEMYWWGKIRFISFNMVENISIDLHVLTATQQTTPGLSFGIFLLPYEPSWASLLSDMGHVTQSLLSLQLPDSQAPDTWWGHPRSVSSQTTARWLQTHERAWLRGAQIHRPHSWLMHL